MVKEFNLYEKRKQLIKDLRSNMVSRLGTTLIRSIEGYLQMLEHHLIEQDKEFIEVLKDTIMIKQENPTEMVDEYNKELFDKIDKLVGEN